MVVLSFVVALIFPNTGLQQTPQLIKRLKVPYTMAEDIKKHFAPQIGMDTTDRLIGYEKRLKLESDSITQALNWRAVGPEVQGGRVIRILSNPKNPDEVYVAYATGGLWKTRDGGVTWKALFEKQSSFGIGDMAIGSDGKTIWVGTGEHNSQRTSYQGTGVFKSSDSGATWEHVGLEDINHTGAITVNPKNQNEVLVGGLGHLYSSNSERGTFRTTDGGNTWSHTLKINDVTGVIDMVLDPNDPKTVYASSWDRERRAWDFRDGGPGTAIYKSTNSGVTWQRLDGGLPSGDLGRIGLSVSESNPNVVYAFIDNWNADPDTIYDDEYAPSGTLTPWRFLQLKDDQFNQIPKEAVERFVTRHLPAGTKVDDIIQGVKDKKMTLEDVAQLMEKRNASVFAIERVTHQIWRSDDKGRTWRKTHAYRFGVHGGYYFGEVRVNPTNPEDVWTLGTLLLRSKDGGKTWKRTANGVHVDFHDLWFDPRDSKRMVVGCDGGAYFSGDGGETWRHWNNLPVGQTTTLAVDNKVPYNIYVGLQDNGTLVGPSTYNPGRSSLSSWKAIGGGDGSWIAVDPRDDGDLVYVASQWGSHQAVNQKTNERWGAAARAQQGQTPLRYQWISPLIISSHHPDILYLGSQFVHRSMNKGRNWTTISPDLTSNREVGDVPYSTIKVLDESPFKFGQLIAGTDDGFVKLTVDHGTTWTDITPPVKNKWVSRVLFSKFETNTIYVTQTGYREDDYRPYVWRSTDLGKNWTSIASNLPLEFVNSLKEDPREKSVLYLATGIGVYRSVDTGQSWEVLGGSFPRCAVHDIVIHPRDLEIVAATHGKSVWVFDLKQLDKLTPEIQAKSIHMFDLPTMAFTDTWTMRRSQNYDGEPPREPTVGSWLWLKSGGKGTIKIRDAAAKVMKEKAFDAVRGLQQWSIELVLTPATSKWAIDNKNRPRTTIEEILADPFGPARGKYLPAGEYSVEIAVGDATQTVKWKLL